MSSAMKIPGRNLFIRGCRRLTRSELEQDCRSFPKHGGLFTVGAGRLAHHVERLDQICRRLAFERVVTAEHNAVRSCNIESSGHRRQPGPGPGRVEIEALEEFLEPRG